MRKMGNWKTTRNNYEYNCLTKFQIEIIEIMMNFSSSEITLRDIVKKHPKIDHDLAVFAALRSLKLNGFADYDMKALEKRYMVNVRRYVQYWSLTEEGIKAYEFFKENPDLCRETRWYLGDDDPEPWKTRDPWVTYNTITRYEKHRKKRPYLKIDNKKGINKLYTHRRQKPKQFVKPKRLQKISQPIEIRKKEL